MTLLTYKQQTHISSLNSEQIKELQTILKKIGHNPGVIDGIYGNDTLFAFNQFKKKYQLTNSGIWGPTTAEFLTELLDGKLDIDEIEAPSSKQIETTTQGFSTPSSIDWTDFSCPISKYFTV